MVFVAEDGVDGRLCLGHCEEAAKELVDLGLVLLLLLAFGLEFVPELVQAAARHKSVPRVFDYLHK